jgi:two-component system C4-dicarboxylate transport sensor histidine kinase DctB
MMYSRKRIGLTLLALMVSAALVFVVYLFAARKASNDIHAAAERQLQIIALDLESMLEKFETLPFAIAFHPDVVQALTQPSDPALIRRLNLTLQSIQRQAKVGAIYLMDRDGNTLASSNWDQPLSFVGRNFGFRPYFREALAGSAGRFYGIGNVTSEPGYFIAQPVYPLDAALTATPVGVIAVKISLAEFEHAWNSSEEPLALADRNEVVFLSNRQLWKYHSMQVLNGDAQHRLADTQQYAGQMVQPISRLPARQQAGFGEHVSKRVGRLGWRLMLFPSPARITRVALLSTLAAILLLVVGLVSWWAMHQRRQRLEERRESRKALQQAAEELDRKIAQRTEELLQTNGSLETKYAKLKEAERILRTTQTELVQAGKLATLGQMAAGVTHELNQPLTAIRAFADNAVTFLQRGQTSQAGANLAQISAAAARMGAIIGQLKGFARKSHGAVSTVDLAQAIQASAMLLGGDFRRHQTQLELEIGDVLHVTGDALRTEQVLINLLHNALDAVEGAAVRRVTVLLRREAQEAVVCIRDSGHGIPLDAAQHLFEPFFTTKPAGKGLGLGLAISSSIVQAMGGQLTAHNLADGGAEFTLRLPLRQNQEFTAKGEQLAST